MLNNDYKEKAVNDLYRVNDTYTSALKKTVGDIERLQNTRNISVRTIQYIERYIVTLANKPREFETKLGKIKLKYIEFQKLSKEIREKEIEQEKYIKGGVAGAIGGAQIARLGLNTRTSIAMTFGTVSTKTAMEALSGVSATSSSLAWLGGSAFAGSALAGSALAGSASLVGGDIFINTFLGPIGWVIGGISIAGTLAAVNMSNKEIAEKAENSIRTIKKETERIKEIDIQVLSWNEETKKLSNALMSRLSHIKSNRKRDYTTFTNDEVDELVSIFNATEVLSNLLNKTIKEEK